MMVSSGELDTGLLLPDLVERLASLGLIGIQVLDILTLKVVSKRVCEPRGPVALAVARNERERD